MDTAPRVIVAEPEGLAAANAFADEEAEPLYGYRSGYKEPEPLEVQVASFRECWPGLEPGRHIIQLERRLFVPGAEGLFAIVRWEALAPTYEEGLEREVFAAITAQRRGGFENWRKGKLGPRYRRETVKTAEAFARLHGEQPGSDFIVFPGQFGRFHRHCSVRRARVRMQAREFGLDAFAVGCMLLVHPMRLRHCDDVWINCAGERLFVPCAADPFGKFELAPWFGLSPWGVVTFDANRVYNKYAHSSSASGFALPALA